MPIKILRKKTPKPVKTGIYGAVYHPDGTAILTRDGKHWKDGDEVLAAFCDNVSDCLHYLGRCGAAISAKSLRAAENGAFDERGDKSPFNWDEIAGS